MVLEGSGFQDPSTIRRIHFFLSYGKTLAVQWILKGSPKFPKSSPEFPWGTFQNFEDPVEAFWKSLLRPKSNPCWEVEFGSKMYRGTVCAAVLARFTRLSWDRVRWKAEIKEMNLKKKSLKNIYFLFSKKYFSIWKNIFGGKTSKILKIFSKETLL